MTISFTDLAENLPAGAIEYVGNNQVKLNFSQISDETLTLESSMVEVVVKFLQGLTSLTNQINQLRNAQNPPLPPIVFASGQLVGTAAQPRYQFVVEVAVNAGTFLSNLVDPTQ
jgi:hypothetical protein